GDDESVDDVLDKAKSAGVEVDEKDPFIFTFFDRGLGGMVRDFVWEFRYGDSDLGDFEPSYDLWRHTTSTTTSITDVEDKVEDQLQLPSCLDFLALGEVTSSVYELANIDRKIQIVDDFSQPMCEKVAKVNYFLRSSHKTEDKEEQGGRTQLQDRHEELEDDRNDDTRVEVDAEDHNIFNKLRRCCMANPHGIMPPLATDPLRSLLRNLEIVLGDGVSAASSRLLPSQSPGWLSQPPSRGASALFFASVSLLSSTSDNNEYRKEQGVVASSIFDDARKQIAQAVTAQFSRERGGLLVTGQRGCLKEEVLRSVLLGGSSTALGASSSPSTSSSPRESPRPLCLWVDSTMLANTHETADNVRDTLRTICLLAVHFSPCV
ncbi:unnamed protein product, partial [Amoebophrya sp. A25]